eukprot:CAMPEP_0194310120 /NCGR_PEP_ID=MMETSP0171-20130528/7062_1 /TAXON_ID=218684 /ORGANISM="Corethron pennatum, Strain L29A3" /LENGTH=197 /DNA_ID=CAMNT_0039063585 /DNA_START=196 /DNA_END=786 /DNA_ORIENTATION=+
MSTASSLPTPVSVRESVASIALVLSSSSPPGPGAPASPTPAPWTDRFEAISSLSSLAERCAAPGPGSAEASAAFLESLRQSGGAVALGDQLADLRSKITGAATSVMTDIVQHFGGASDGHVALAPLLFPVVESWLAPLSKLTINGNKLMGRQGSNCLLRVVAHCGRPDVAHADGRGGSCPCPDPSRLLTRLLAPLVD